MNPKTASCSPWFPVRIGVKIDRKRATVRDQDITLLLWDLEGGDTTVELRPSYLRGAAAVFYVVDGT
jgi:GTPase SAR1 family protein